MLYAIIGIASAIAVIAIVAIIIIAVHGKRKSGKEKRQEPRLQQSALKLEPKQEPNAWQELQGELGETAVAEYIENHIQSSEILINNLIIETKTYSTEIDHVVIKHNGIFIIETKNRVGYIEGDDESDNWFRVKNDGARDCFSNPVKQNAGHVYTLARETGIEEKYMIPLVVFVQSNVQGVRSQHTVPLDGLSRRMNQSTGVTLSTTEINGVYKKLMSVRSDISKEEHVRNIEKNKRERAIEQQKIGQGICPRCGGKLILRKTAHSAFYGCSHFPDCKFSINP